VEVKCKTMIRK